MAKKRRSQKSRMVPEQREYLHIATPKRAASSIIRQIEDRREYNPFEDPHPEGYLHRSSRLIASPNVNRERKNEVPHRITFAVPDEVAVCVRRKDRREVLFAMGRTGKGARKKNRRRNYASKMECK